MTNSLPNETGKTFQGFLEIINTMDSSPTKQSNIVYIDILNEYSDNKDTILNVLSVLQDKLKVGTNANFLGVIGDGKTYDHQHTLKIEYGSEANPVARRLAYPQKLPGSHHEGLF